MNINETISRDIPEWAQQDSTNAYMIGDKFII